MAGALCGIEPVWAAEVEPYPIAVTRSRFPNMKHLGDISKVNGAEIEPVDIITFGSPCQDLSVAGKRAGLKHTENGDEETTRSGLFMEAVRIIKEMRKATNGKYPTFALWENVPGAFSSNAGQDFRIVCEELIKIIEPTAVMPEVPQKGWNYSDSYIGDGWSLAYRVLDKGIRNQDIDENKAIVQEMPRGSTHYIVRRLTPTECARLQGFADQWGVVDTKTFLTDVEFKFWTDVRNTHAAINGKKVQEYTRKQMLAWYNKLWTDSAEYKMWGNGIALPTALYTIQGIADALDAAEMIAEELNGATEAIEDWML